MNYQITKHFITVCLKLVKKKAILGKSTLNIMLHFIVFLVIHAAGLTATLRD